MRSVSGLQSRKRHVRKAEKQPLPINPTTLARLCPACLLSLLAQQPLRWEATCNVESAPIKDSVLGSVAAAQQSIVPSPKLLQDFRGLLLVCQKDTLGLRGPSGVSCVGFIGVSGFGCWGLGPFGVREV